MDTSTGTFASRTLSSPSSAPSPLRKTRLMALSFLVSSWRNASHRLTAPCLLSSSSSSSSFFSQNDQHRSFESSLPAQQTSRMGAKVRLSLPLSHMPCLLRPKTRHSQRRAKVRSDITAATARSTRMDRPPPTAPNSTPTTLLDAASIMPSGTSFSHSTAIGSVCDHP